MAKEVHTVAGIQARWNGLFEALNHEEDSVCAVVSGSYVEACIRALLMQYFVKSSQVERILSPTKGALGAAGNAAFAAYLLGLISSPCHENIKTIQEIRNKFAHSIDSLTFSSTEVVKLCDQLTKPYIHAIGPTPEALTRISSARWHFVQAAMILCSDLMIKALDTKHRERIKDIWGDDRKSQE